MIKKFLLKLIGLSALLRILFVVFVPSVAIKALTMVYGEDKLSPSEVYAYIAVSTVFAIAVVIYEWRFQKEIVRDLVAIVFGTATGLMVSVLIVMIAVAFFLPSSVTLSGSPLPLSEAFTQAFWRVQPWIPLILLACCYIAITVVLQTKGDFRFLVPYIDFSQRSTQEGGLLLDTSAIIDGRIVSICKTRIISVPLVIPDYVIRELQTLSDSTNKVKRMRGRRGLDIVADLQKSDSLRVVIRETEVPPGRPVDEELVATAKEINARIVTTDFNLNKVSRIEGVVVVNINDLANAMKPTVMPGEQLQLKIIKPGQEAGQGVGYLEDGTMVVVEEAKKHIGQTIIIDITGQIQTSAGRMIFGKPAEEG